MIKTTRIVLAATIAYLCLALAGSAQDKEEPINPEPPVRLKKKNPREAKPDEPKKEEPKKEGPKQPQERIGDPPAGGAAMEDENKKTLERIAQNMRAAEDRIAKKDLDEGTKQVQQDIIKDLDSLIDQMQQQQQQAGGGGQGGRQQARNQKNGNQQANGQKNAQKNGQKSGQGDQQANGNNPKEQPGNGNEPGKGGDGQTGKNPIADAYKDIWGHLPEKMRQEMDAYGREQFMAKYQDLLKQYYATIAEKGRKRGE